MRQGIRFGDYWLLGRLNSGGMAEVFLGKRTHGEGAGRLLAIKRMLPRLSGDPQFVEMFNDEARIANSLKHPNICQIFDQGQIEQTLFIAMEFIHGKDLKIVHRRAKQRGEPIPVRHIAYICARMATALDYAHAKTNDDGEPENIVHRDISPQNILISYDGTPKLIDFGIAKAKDRIAKTKVGVVKGKFVYMSPEQATGQAVDGRTDVFALGVVMYELIAGRLPFKGSSDFSTLKKIANATHLPIEQIAPDVPRRLAGIITRALARNPDERYPTGADLAADLERYLADERKEVTDATISSFMRRVFRDDYIREGGRIRDFLNFEVPDDGAPDPEPVPSHADRTHLAGKAPAKPESEEETTNVTEDSQSRILAAGYDSTVISDVKKVQRTAEIELGVDDEIEPDAPAEAAAARDAAPPSSFFPGTTDSAQPADEISFEEASAHFGAKTVEIELPAVVPEQQAPAMGRDRIHTGEIDAAVESVLDLEEDGGTQTTSVVSEVTDLDVQEESASDRRDTDEQAALEQSWEEGGGTIEMDVQEVDNILAEARRMAGTDSSASRTTDPDQPAIDGAVELRNVTEPGRPPLEPAGERDEPTATAEQPMPVDLDMDEETGADLLLTDEDVQFEESRGDASFDEFDIDIDEEEGDMAETMALSPSGAGLPSGELDQTLPPASPTPASAVAPASAQPPPARLFTGGEIAVLLLAVVLGVAGVLGAYWYASTQPVELTPTQTIPMPTPSSPGGP